MLCDPKKRRTTNLTNDQPLTLHWKNDGLYIGSTHPASNSHHRDDYILVGNPYKLTVTGWGVTYITIPEDRSVEYGIKF